MASPETFVDSGMHMSSKEQDRNPFGRSLAE
jgi:hypothetical protein